MRVLQVHKFFYPHAGSETVLFHTRELLRSRGHEVIDFSMVDPRNLTSPYADYFSPPRSYNDETRPIVSRTIDALASIYSPSSRSQLRKLIADTRPDIAHLHLVYHQLTMSVVDELHRSGVPMTMTLHDYKIGCPAYTFFRDGAPCHDCVGTLGTRAAQHRCVKGSLAASSLAAVEFATSHGLRKYHKIDSFVCPSRFVRDIALATGIPGERLVVVPNFLPDAETSDPVSNLADEPTFFFAGRLEPVKGIDDLMQAFIDGPVDLGTLVVAGAGGQLEDRVRDAAASCGRIDYVGRLSRDEVLVQLRASRAAVLPARWEENNPMSLLEARAAGVPVVVSDRGGLKEMVSDGVDGLVVPAGNVDALRDALWSLASDRDFACRLGRAGYERYLAENSETAHYTSLMAAYDLSVTTRAAR